MNEWITRQGCIINYARASKKKATMVRGYKDKKNIGRPGKEVFSEKLTRTRNADPNIIGVPDGLLYRTMNILRRKDRKTPERSSNSFPSYGLRPSAIKHHTLRAPCVSVREDYLTTNQLGI
ncbi:MAG: hypothetical protein EOL87_12850 [Spartobacteria bacterium]|nr:hypothetical protein [Spartobacteria bacterium]